VIKANGPLWSQDEADQLKAAIAESRALDIAEGKSDRRAVMGKHITVEVEPESKLAQAVKNTDIDDLTAIIDGRVFQLTEKNVPRWDADAARAHLHRLAGFLSEEEADQMKEEIYRAREEGSAHNFPE
jgi:hypothetical protein